MSKKTIWILSALLILTIVLGVTSCAPAPAEPAEEAEEPAAEVEEAGGKGDKDRLPSAIRICQ